MWQAEADRELTVSASPTTVVGKFTGQGEDMQGANMGWGIVCDVK